MCGRGGEGEKKSQDSTRRFASLLPIERERLARKSLSGGCAATDVSSTHLATIGITLAAVGSNAKRGLRMSSRGDCHAFMLHIVPRGVHRRLDRCRKLLIEYNKKNDIHYTSSSAASSTSASTPLAAEPKQTALKQAERNLPKCARCKTPEMKSLGFQDARTTRAIIAITQRVVALYTLSWTTFDDWSQYL